MDNIVMTSVIRHNESKAFCVVNHTDSQSYVVVSNETEKLFEYTKQGLDTGLIQFIINEKLLNCVCLN